jgi:hypothetical protein
VCLYHEPRPLRDRAQGYPGLSSSELKARYRRLMIANHPDKVAQLDPEIEGVCQQEISPDY